MFKFIGVGGSRIVAENTSKSLDLSLQTLKGYKKFYETKSDAILFLNAVDLPKKVTIKLITYTANGKVIETFK